MRNTWNSDWKYPRNWTKCPWGRKERWVSLIQMAGKQPWSQVPVINQNQRTILKCSSQFYLRSLLILGSLVISFFFFFSFNQLCFGYIKVKKKIENGNLSQLFIFMQVFVLPDRLNPQQEEDWEGFLVIVFLPSWLRQLRFKWLCQKIC